MGVPATGVGAVSLNVTLTESAAAGFVSVYPCGTRPLASNLNYSAGQTVPNAVIPPLSPVREICISSIPPSPLLADLNGWFPSGAGFNALAPVRVFDSRPSEPQG